MQAISPAASQLALEGLNLTLVIVVLVISLIALAMGAMFRGQVLAADPGTPRMQEIGAAVEEGAQAYLCLLYTSPSPRDRTRSRMPSSA